MGIFLLIEDAQETTEVGDLLFADLIEFGNFIRIISMMRKAMITGTQLFPVDGKDLPLPRNQERNDTGGIRFQRQSHEVVHDGFAFK